MSIARLKLADKEEEEKRVVRSRHSMPRNHLHSPALFAIFIMVIGLGFCISGPEDILVELLILVSILREILFICLVPNGQPIKTSRSLAGFRYITLHSTPQRMPWIPVCRTTNTQLSQLFFSWLILANLIEFRRETKCPFNSRRLNFYFSRQGVPVGPRRDLFSLQPDSKTRNISNHTD